MSHDYHQPVLLNESIHNLVSNKSGMYVDATYGGGGHTKAILKATGRNAKVFAFDQDTDALKNTITDERLTIIESNFRFFENFLKLYKAIPIDGLLADLGVSSHHFNTPERGFSTRFESKLDMRMNKNQSLDAISVLNNYEEDALSAIFKQYGEIRSAKAMAKQLVLYRKKDKILYPSQIQSALSTFLKGRQAGKIMRLIFQSIRIEVNDELEALKALLKAAERTLKPGGKLAVISYHSLEDRMVKNFLKTGNFKGELQKDLHGNIIRQLKPAFSKPIQPKAREVLENSRAKSAKMRIGIKL